MQGRLALYGLSADPPHDGHGAILTLLAQHFDSVYCWAADNPLKADHGASLPHRQAMVAALTHRLGASIQHRPEFTSPWTAESAALVHFCHPEAELWVAVGSDALAQVAHWYALKLLVARITGFVEIARAGHILERTLVAGLPVLSLTETIPPWASQSIRSALAQGRVPPGLTPEVYAYIQRTQLYGVR